MNLQSGRGLLCGGLLILLTGCDGGSGSSAPQQGFALAFSPLERVLYQNVPVEPIAATSPVAAFDFVVDPPLPAGLQIDPVSGTIAGTPTAAAPLTRYTVSASGPGGAAGSGALDLEVVPPPRFVVAANESDSTISTFEVDARSGLLRHRWYRALPSSQRGPRRVAVHRSGGFVFVLNAAGGTLSAHRLEPGEGRLLESTTVPVGDEPSALVQHPSLDVLYTLDAAGGGLFSVAFDPATGGLALLGAPLATGGEPSALSATPDGRWLYVASRSSSRIEQYALDPQTGAPTFVSATQVNTMATWLEIDALGRHLYFVTDSFDLIARFVIDPSSGALLMPQTRPTGAVPRAIACHPRLAILYVSNSAAGTITRFAVHPTSGALMPREAVAAGNAPGQLLFTPSAREAWVVGATADQIVAFDVDPTDGRLTRADDVRSRRGPAAIALVSGEHPLRREARTAYVPSRAADQVDTFTVDVATGTLTPLGLAPLTGDEPADIAVDPLRRFAFVCNEATDDISRFSIDPANGMLFELGARVPCAGEPRALAIDPSGRFLYVASRAAQAVQAFEIGADGGLAVIETEAVSNPNPRALVIDPTGQNLYVVNEGVAGNPAFPGDVTVFRIDADGGTLQSVQGGALAGGMPKALSFARGGTVAFTAKSSGGNLSATKVDELQGTLAAPSNPLDQPQTPTDLVLSADGRFAIATLFDGSDSGLVVAFAVDDVDGTLTPLDQLSDGDEPMTLAIHPAGSIVYVVNRGSNDVSILAVDPQSGELSIAGSPTATGPLPSSIALLEVGM